MSSSAAEDALMDHDYSEEVDQKIPEYCAPVRADASKLDEALENLLAFEKKTRLASDTKSTVKLAKTILSLCVETKQWQTLNDHVTLLCKRRAQLRRVVATVVQEGARYLAPPADDDKDPVMANTAVLRTDLKLREALVVTLRAVSDGIMAVELDRAKLTLLLAQMKEREGDVEAAASVMQEMQVETIGTMDAKEKCEMLLEQVRLTLATRDFIRTEIISNKVNTEVLERTGRSDDAGAKKPKKKKGDKDQKGKGDVNKQVDADGNEMDVVVTKGGDVKVLQTLNAGEVQVDEAADMSSLKIKYYKLMNQYHMHERAYLKSAQGHYRMFQTPSVQADGTQWRPALARAVAFTLLSPYDSEMSDLLARLSTVKQLDMGNGVDDGSDDISVSRRLVKLFTTPELISWPLRDEAELKASPVFAGGLDAGILSMKDSKNGGDEDGDVVMGGSKKEQKQHADSISDDPAVLKQRWEDFHKRVVQHNIRVIAANYARIRSARAAELLQLDEDTMESYLSEMVSDGQLYARMDRPAGIIVLQKKQNAEQVINAWRGNIVELLDLVESTCHLISKENIHYQIKA